MANQKEIIHLFEIVAIVTQWRRKCSLIKILEYFNFEWKIIQSEKLSISLFYIYIMLVV